MKERHATPRTIMMISIASAKGTAIFNTSSSIAGLALDTFYSSYHFGASMIAFDEEDLFFSTSNESDVAMLTAMTSRLLKKLPSGYLLS